MVDTIVVITLGRPDIKMEILALFVVLVDPLLLFTFGYKTEERLIMVYHKLPMTVMYHQYKTQWPQFRSNSS